MPRRALLLTSGLVLAACARYVPGTFDPAAAPTAYVASRDTLAADSLAAMAGPGASPVAVLALEALARRTDLAAASARITAAELDIAVAGRRPAPGFDGQLERLVYGQSQGAPWVVGLTPTLRLEFGGKAAARRVAAAAQASRERMAAGLLAWSIVGEVRRAAFEHGVAERLRDDAAAARAAQAAVVVALEARHARGEIGITAVQEARRELLRLEGAAVQQDRARQEATRRLALALQRRPDGVVAAASPDVAASCEGAVADTVALRRSALQGRYEIGVALADLAMADAEVRLAVAAASPDLALAPGFIWDQSTNRWTLGLGLPEIRFDRNRAAVRAAEARRAAAGVAAAAAQIAVLAELDGLRHACATLREERIFAVRTLAGAADLLDGARRRVARGEAGGLDTLAARAAHAEARLLLTSADAAIGRLVLDLDLAAARWATGGPSRWPALARPSFPSEPS